MKIDKKVMMISDTYTLKISMESERTWGIEDYFFQG